MSDHANAGEALMIFFPASTSSKLKSAILHVPTAINKIDNEKVIGIKA